MKTDETTDGSIHITHIDNKMIMHPTEVTPKDRDCALCKSEKSVYTPRELCPECQRVEWLILERMRMNQGKESYGLTPPDESNLFECESDRIKREYAERP